MSGSGQCAGRLVFWLTMSVCLASAVAAASTSMMRRSDRLLDKQQQIRPSSSDWDAVGQPARRITPKSVFVAPALSGCSDGYRQDGLGRCVKLVKVNQAAQLDFLLQKLNSKFASPLGDAGKPGKAEPDAGPFRVSIPIGGDVPRETTTTTTVVTTTDAFVDGDDLSTETTTRPQNNSFTKTIRYPQSSSTGVPVTLSASNFAPHRRRQPPNEDAGKPFVIVVADTTLAPTTLPTITSLSDHHEDHTHTEATPLPETFTTFASETTTSPSAPPPSTVIPTTNIDTEETTAGYTFRPLRKPFPEVTPITWLESTTQVPSTTFFHSETVPGGTEYYTQPPTTSEDHQTDITINTTPLDLEAAVEDGSVNEDRFSTTSSVVATGNSDPQQLILPYGEDVTEGVLEDPFRAATEPPEDQSTDCATWPANQEHDGCRPMRVVTTSSSYYIRFPTESAPFRPPVSYSTLEDNRPKNGFIRFPGISPPRRTPSQTSSSNYGANRPWNNDASSGDGVSMASSSSVFASWFPFLQQQPSRHWIDRYNNNNNYHKQQQHFEQYYGSADGIDFHRKQNRYHRRPIESTSSHVLPAWFDKHIVSWPQSSD